MFKRSERPSRRRRGAVAVEFAIMAPVLLCIVLGLIELSRVYEVQNVLEIAAREGARFAAMDRTGMVGEGQSGNAKLVNDVKGFLASQGIDADAIDVQVVRADGSGQPFDIDDPANDLALFEVRVSVSYDAINVTPLLGGGGDGLTATITFRNGKAIS